MTATGKRVVFTLIGATIETYFKVPAGYYRIASGARLRSVHDAKQAAHTHREETGQPVCFVRRPSFREGLPLHVYAQATRAGR